MRREGIFARVGYIDDYQPPRETRLLLKILDRRGNGSDSGQRFR